jgi:hypothetical protein
VSSPVTENAWTKTVRTAEQKLTVYPAGFFGEGSGEYLEFYDLADDPWETTNLAATDDPPREAIDRHLRYLRDFLQTQRRAASALTVDRAPGSLADGTVRPSDVAAHLDEHDGDNYL